MKSIDFAGLYDRDRASTIPTTPEMAKAIAPLINWSMHFGTVLHDAMTDKLEEGDAWRVHELIQGYNHWASSTEGPRIRRLVESLPGDDAARTNALSAFQFHALNMPMHPLWYHAFAGKVEGSDRIQAIEDAQDLICIASLRSYIAREKLAKAKTGYSYFSPDNALWRKSFEGSVNEADIGIVLLEVCKSRRLNVLPAPRQFEASRRQNRNVDYLVFDDLDEVAGVQAKTKVTDSQINYDEDIVIIDADLDLGNRLAMRTETRRSDIRVVSWAGIIAAHHFLRIPPLKPKKLARLGIRSPKEQTLLRMQAQQYTRGIRDVSKEAVEAVGAKLDAKI